MLECLGCVFCVLRLSLDSSQLLLRLPCVKKEKIPRGKRIVAEHTALLFRLSVLESCRRLALKLEIVRGAERLGVPPDHSLQPGGHPLLG